MDNDVPTAGDDQLEDISAALDPQVETYREKLGLMHVNTVAAVLGLNADTLRQWRKERRGPNFVQIGKRVWYVFDDIQNWLKLERYMTNEQRRDYSKMSNTKPGPGNEPQEDPAGKPPSTPYPAPPEPGEDTPGAPPEPEPSEKNHPIGSEGAGDDGDRE